MAEQQDAYKCANCDHEPHCGAGCSHEDCDCNACDCGHDRGEL